MRLLNVLAAAVLSVSAFGAGGGKYITLVFCALTYGLGVENGFRHRKH